MRSVVSETGQLGLRRWGNARAPGYQFGRQAERNQEFKPRGRGWCVGSEEFTVTVSWMARRLGMRTRGHLVHLDGKTVRRLGNLAHR